MAHSNPKEDVWSSAVRRMTDFGKAEELSFLRGQTYEDQVRAMLNAIMTNNVAEKFPWQGASGKEKFMNLKFHPIISDAVRRTEKFSSISDSEVKEGINNWLRLAKGRKGNRTATPNKTPGTPSTHPMALRSGSKRKCPPNERSSNGTASKVSRQLFHGNDHEDVDGDLMENDSDVDKTENEMNESDSNFEFLRSGPVQSFEDDQASGTESDILKLNYDKYSRCCAKLLFIFAVATANISNCRPLL